jgi:hypothetical protein
MESNENTNYGQGEQQKLRKRKFNELANDSQPTTEEEQKQHQPNQPPEKLRKKKCDGQQENDTLLEVCILHCWPKIIGIS